MHQSVRTGKSFDELVNKSKSDYKDFLQQLDDARQQLKNPPGENIHPGKTDFAEQISDKVDYSPYMNLFETVDILAQLLGSQ